MRTLRSATFLSALLTLACAEMSWRDAVPADWPYSLDAAPVQAANGMVVSTDRYAILPSHSDQVYAIDRDPTRNQPKRVENAEIPI